MALYGKQINQVDAINSPRLERRKVEDMLTSQQGADNSLLQNIPRYFVYTAIKNFGFGLFLAVWLVYLQRERGLSLSQAALIDVTFFVAGTVSEVPTGIVADRYGRRTSMMIGAALMSVSTFAWVFAPTLPLLMVAYACFGMSVTFLSGAEDALFYESVQRTGRANEYTRLVGRVSASGTVALALGSVIAGLLATINLKLPFLIAGLGHVIVLMVIMSLKEPQFEDSSHEAQTRKPFGDGLKQALGLLLTRPALRYLVLYLAFVPLAAFLLETFFVQPQVLTLGVPLGGVGMVLMVLQLANVGGSNWSHQFAERFGEKRVLEIIPGLIVLSLVLLALFQKQPILLLVAFISFLTTTLRPIIMSQIQHELTDEIRATMLSVQSLIFMVVVAISQPSLGLIADRVGLPAAYLILAVGLGMIVLALVWIEQQRLNSRTKQDHL